MLGMGPLLWHVISPEYAEQDPPLDREFVELSPEVYLRSARYYRAVDAITRNDRLVCTCSIREGRHDITGVAFAKKKAFP